MERDDRPPVATFFTDATLAAGKTIALSEAAAHHARVKRLEVGDAVRVTDGDGHVATGDIAALPRGGGEVLLASVADVPRPAPIHLRVPIGDRDRMLWLAEKATELGVASWQAVRFRRSLSVSPRGEGPQFADKARARMISALEQSGGAWLPQILPDANLDAVSVREGATRILLDVGGAPLLQVADGGEAVLLLGPEGGLEPDEREVLVGAAWHPARLAATTLRFETAGLAAAAVLRAAQMLREI